MAAIPVVYLDAKDLRLVDYIELLSLGNPETQSLDPRLAYLDYLWEKAGNRQRKAEKSGYRPGGEQKYKNVWIYYGVYGSKVRGYAIGK